MFVTIHWFQKEKGHAPYPISTRGARRLFRAAGANCAKEASIQGEGGKLHDRGILPRSVITFFVNTAQLKHEKFGALLSSRQRAAGKGGRGSRQLWLMKALQLPAEI